MGYQELLEALNRQIEEERDSILKEADRRSKVILDGAKREIAKMEEALAQDDFHEANVEAEKIRAKARQEINRRIVTAKRAAIDQVREAIGRKLSAFRQSKRYPDLMKILVNEVVEALPEAKTWVTDPKDAPVVKEILASHNLRNVSFEADDRGLGGVTAISSDGRLRHYNSFEARLNKVWAELEVTIGEHLTTEEK